MSSINSLLCSVTRLTPPFLSFVCCLARMTIRAQNLQPFFLAEHPIYNGIPRYETHSRIDDRLDMIDHRIVDAALIAFLRGEGGRNLVRKSTRLDSSH